ncbi:DUF222 domain-containing protein [Rhodococcus sp. G-MC3]|uniref:HNH endonuclease signature motif containing protein n=1 Tax=Rhodococcus sp. G-MC3 TaxID=3046209 RepID=UPI0024B995EB|nr:HNH endonuclease signature motif containing protein [Rhodococcus sp. G-MC3]MDJ0394663.1 DUF222 domain-containing protein [Rhodococcus sp. G-MC3]
MLSGENVAGLADDLGVATPRGVLPIADPCLLDAVVSMESAWVCVAAVASIGLLDADKRALMVRMETLSRAMYGTSHTWLTELIDSDGLAVMPEKKNPSRLASLLRINAGVAGKRIRIAAKIAVRRAMTGEKLDPVLPTTAVAHTSGEIDAAHVTIIDKFFGDLPEGVDHESRVQSEFLLSELAKQVSPEQLQVAADRLQTLLDPDGSLRDEPDPIAKCFFRLGKQDAEGLSKGSFLIDAEFRAYLEALLAKLAKPGNCNPDEPKPVVEDEPGEHEPDGGSGDRPDAKPGNPTLFDGPSPGPGPGGGDSGGTGDSDGSGSGGPGSGESGTTPRDTVTDPDMQRRAGRDTRTQGRRNHDAVKAVLRQMLASGTLGEHRGLPVTAIISMTAQDLETACGHAVTGTGSLIPMRDAIRMASHAHQYLAVFDDADGRALYLGRTKRIATADQRIVLIARDRGCSFPGCTRPATWSQVHHIDEWASGGNTDVDAMTFGCDIHHALVGDGSHDWATTTTGPGHPTPGRTQWHPPGSVDPDRRGVVNHFHHPQEYLYHDPEDPEP